MRNTGHALRFRAVLRRWAPFLIGVCALVRPAGLPVPSGNGGSGFLDNSSPSGSETARLVQSREGPERGKFLVAARKLQDPNFAHSVVLLVDYGRYGAMGLIINYPTGMTLSELMPATAGLERHADSVYLGGPVARNRLIVLGAGPAPDDVRYIIPDVYLTSDPAYLKRLAEDGESVFRVFAGHAGWAPGQLEWEIARGDWHILPADRESILEKDAVGLWEDLIQRTESQLIRAAPKPGRAARRPEI